jgi:DNA mismatch repair protein MutS
MNLTIGIDGQDGILLYGLNSAGKSTLQKSVGINIILAQIGYFVAATEFNYYPYKSLMTRITSNDNLFKGLSSFALEISDLRAILKRSNENTLIFI